MLYNERIEAVAKREIADQEGIDASEISRVECGYPELTSAVTAIFWVRVWVRGNDAAYEVPITTRVDYTHPVAVPDA